MAQVAPAGDSCELVSSRTVWCLHLYSNRYLSSCSGRGTGAGRALRTHLGSKQLSQTHGMHFGGNITTQRVLWSGQGALGCQHVTYALRRSA
jgi:hypothetical protein